MLDTVFTGRNFEKIGSLMGKIIHQNKELGEKRANNENIDSLLDLLFNMFIEIFDISTQISNELIVSHTIHRKDSKQIMSLKQLKKYILDTNLSGEEWENRRNFLKLEIQDVIKRQMALYAGYRDSIKYGTPDLLKTLDPIAVKKNILTESFKFGPIKISYKYFPFIINHLSFKRLVCIYNSLNKKSYSQITEKYFRPAFIRGYLQSIKSDQVNSENINNLIV